MLSPYFERNGIQIYCGDCRDILPNLPKSDLIITDPPYGVDYDGGTTLREKIAGDFNANMYRDVLPIIRKNAKDDAAFYIFYADGDAQIVIEVFSAVLKAGLIVRNNLIWNKSMAQFGALSAQYKQKHEPFLYCHIRGKSPKWRGETNETTVWDFKRASSNNFHPTQKPVGLIEKCIMNSSDRDDIVCDPFMGGGTTLVAAKLLGRKAVGIEINESYCETAAFRLSQEVLNFDDV